MKLTPIYESINPRYTNKNVNLGDLYDETDVYSYVDRLHTRDYDFEEGDLGERIESHTKYRVESVPIGKIDLEEFEIDENDVEAYERMYEQNQYYPPLVLDGDYRVIDGTHRGNALRNIGLTHIICFVGI